MPDSLRPALSRRERQIMDILYEKGEASAADVQKVLPDPPSYSAVRALLRILEEKGHVKHTRKGQRYIYSPIVSRERARYSSLQHMVQTFFDGSMKAALLTLLDASKDQLTQEQLDRVARAIDRAFEEGR